MSKNTRSHEAILAEVTRSSERSPLFWWLVEHHDDLIAQSAGRRMSCKALCSLFAGHGLTDIKGRPPSPRMARETWFQARKAVSQTKARKAQAEAETQARPGSTYPSRISSDWRPQVLDNGAVHTSKASTAALAARPWIAVEWLPRYAPELNRIERTWRDLKRHHLAHKTFKTAGDLECAIRAAVKTLNQERQTPHPCDNLKKAA